MSQQQVDQLLGYVQERCLWRFHSRAWDRKENIEGIIAVATDLLHNEHVKRQAPMDKLFYADAKSMVDDFRQRFPWIVELEPAAISDLMTGLKGALIDHTITKSLNHELNHSLY